MKAWRNHWAAMAAVGLAAVQAASIVGRAAEPATQPAVGAGGATAGYVSVSALPAAPPDYAAVIDDLSSDDPRARRIASLKLNSFGSDALPALERALAGAGGNPELTARLRRALPLVRTRARHTARAARLVGYVRQSFVDTYRAGGHTDPRWDAAALAMIERFRTLRHDRPPADRRALIAAFEPVLAQGCRDPLLMAAYASLVGQDLHLLPRHVDAGDLPDGGALFRPGGPARPAVKFVFAAGLVRAGATSLGPRGGGNPVSAAADACNQILADPAAPPGLADELALELHAVFRRPDGPIDPGGVERFRKAYDAGDGKRFGRRVLDGVALTNASLDARFSLEGVVPDRWKRVEELLAAARVELEAAAAMEPGDPRAAAWMITVLAAQDAGRDEVEAWYRRAIQADPDSRDAAGRMLEYLRPGRRGGGPAMVEFGRACARTENWRGGMPFVLIDAHRTLAGRSGDAAAYYAKPEVWADIRAVYEGHLINFPDDVSSRSHFARFATFSEQWAEAHEQFERMGDRGVAEPFGGRETYDYLRRKAARLAGAATRPAG